MSEMTLDDNGMPLDDISISQYIISSVDNLCGYIKWGFESEYQFTAIAMLHIRQILQLLNMIRVVVSGVSAAFFRRGDCPTLEKSELLYLQKCALLITAAKSYLSTSPRPPPTFFTAEAAHFHQTSQLTLFIIVITSVDVLMPFQNFRGVLFRYSPPPNWRTLRR